MIADLEKVQEYRDITQHEIEALKTRFNLADAHTHQRQSPTQQQIVSRLPDLWYEAEEKTQHELEQKFMQRFYRLMGQETALTADRSMLFYAASISMMVAATYFMREKLTVSLIEPCFDNLHDILANMQVPLEPLAEELLHDPDRIYDNLARHVTGDVVCLVEPNNPTGFTLLRFGRSGFEQLVRFCKDHDKILAMDFCFSPFAFMDPDVGRFDVYELLESSGVSYIAMEDTGKTWPLQDAKCALMSASADLYPAIYDIHTSVLLNVSPFILNVLSEYLEDSKRDGFASVRDLLDENRVFVQRELEGTLLRYRKPGTRVSVAWLEIDHPTLTASELQQLAYQRGVYLLPGTYFFWHRPEKGEKFVRLALARQPEVFRGAVSRLKELVDDYRRGHVQA